MDWHSKLQAIVEPAVVALGYELLGLEYQRYGNSSLLRLYIDGPAGIGIDDCESVSRQVSAVLDVEDPIDGEYRLEVSSPGLDRPLFKPAHYEAQLGKTLKLKLHLPLNGRRNFKGTLKAVTAQGLELELDGQVFRISFSSIDKANLVAEFGAKP